MTKLLLATLIVLGSASVNAAATCNPEQEYCPVRVIRSNDGVAAVVTGSLICNPEQQVCAVVGTPQVPAWLEKLNSKAPSSWKAVDPFIEHGN